MADPIVPWISVEDARDFCPVAGDQPDSTVLGFVRSATDILYFHTAQQFGVFQEIIRPCKQPSCLPGTWSWGFLPWGNVWGGAGDAAFPYAPYVPECGCSQMNQFQTDHGPILSVDNITIDGVVFPEFSAGVQNWRVDDRRWIVRLDGKTWPQCQFLDLPITQPGTWQVTYSWGRYPPDSGVLACKQLVCEMLKALNPAARCQLPQRAMRVIRQGLSVQFQDIKQDEERTGLYFVDLFIRTYNPQGLRSQPWIWTPDIPSRGRRTTS